MRTHTRTRGQDSCFLNALPHDGQQGSRWGPADGATRARQTVSDSSSRPFAPRCSSVLAGGQPVCICTLLPPDSLCCPALQLCPAEGGRCLCLWPGRPAVRCWQCPGRAVRWWRCCVGVLRRATALWWVHGLLGVGAPCTDCVWQVSRFDRLYPP